MAKEGLQMFLELTYFKIIQQFLGEVIDFHSLIIAFLKNLAKSSQGRVEGLFGSTGYVSLSLWLLC